MTLTELRYIVTVAATGHFGRAAKQCFVSQPTLSVAIKKLEDELNIAIFERRKNGVSTTDVGKKVIAQAKVTLQQAQVIKEIALNDRDQLSSPLKVGAIHTVGPYLFPKLVHQLRAIARQMPLYIEENFTSRLREKLLEGELDAIIVALPFEETDVVTVNLYHEDFLMLLHPEHPWCARESIAASSLSQTELLLLGEGHCFRDQIIESCQSLQQVLNQQQKATQGSSLETIRMMVSSGLGSSVMPRSAVQAQHTKGLKVIPFSKPTPGRTIALAWRASFTRTKAIDSLLEALNCAEIKGIQHG
ncbi:MAG: LysR family hydrogen peroxide-inducible transcriptional activator [Oceanospirillaceae bacterium]|jgi:LysR family hydrogen peroxide-inducible transcriptional activator